ncbi:hypothetical protein TNCV_1928771 [Trichonephila clavipes]|nr:hypothetical protein TNCV_1928771 [Trichonephila clavipes]
MTVNNSSAEAPDTRGYEKKCWSDVCPESGENDSQKFKETACFYVQSGRGKKKVKSTVVEEVATTVQDESSSGLQPRYAQRIS